MWSSIHKKVVSQSSGTSSNDHDRDDDNGNQTNIKQGNLELRNEEEQQQQQQQLEIIPFEKCNHETIETKNEKKNPKEHPETNIETSIDLSIFNHPSNQFDEISISSQDSLGNTAMVESVFDLQTEQKSICIVDEIQESLSTHHYHHHDDHDSHSLEGNMDVKNEESTSDSNLRTFDNEYEDGNDDDANADDNDGNDDEDDVNDKSDNGKNEKVEVDNISLHEEETISLDSFKRIEKKAALRVKVEARLHNFSSKLFKLKKNTNTPKNDDNNKEKEEERSSDHVLGGIVEKKMLDDVAVGGAKEDECGGNDETEEATPKKPDDSAVVNEGVYLDLGNLMFKDECNSIESDLSKKNHEEEETKLNLARSSYASRLCTKNGIFLAIVLGSFVFNAMDISLFTHEEESEDRIQDQNELINDATSLLLLHMKLKKVEEVMQVHETKSSHVLFIINSLIAMIGFSFFTYSMAKSKMNKGELSNAKQVTTFTSPSTTKKSLKRELSSLDKTNIFPSTVNTQVVQKDGTLTEVKRTMRFSPEAKRFSPPMDSKGMRKVSKAILSPVMKIELIDEKKTMG